MPTVWEFRFESLWTRLTQAGFSTDQAVTAVSETCRLIDEAHRFGSVREANSACAAARRVALAHGVKAV